MAQSTKKKTNRASGKRSTAQRTPAPAPREQGPGARIAGGIVCLLLALCVAVSYFNAEAVFLKLLRTALTGLCGYGYWLWAVMLLAAGLFLLLHRERRAAGRVLCALLTPLLGGSLLHLLLAKPAVGASLSALWTEGQALTGGGVLCGGLAELGKTYISEVVFAILAAIGLLVCIFVMLRTTPAQVAEKARQRAAQRAQEAEGQPESPAEGASAESAEKPSPGGAAHRSTSPWMVSMSPFRRAPPCIVRRSPSSAAAGRLPRTRCSSRPRMRLSKWPSPPSLKQLWLRLNGMTRNRLSPLRLSQWPNP